MNTLNEGGKGGLGMLLAVVGCVLGVVGIIVGMQAKNDSKKAADEVANLSQQLGALSSEDQRLGYAIKDLTDQTKAAITALEAKIPKAPPPRTNVVSRAGSGATQSSKPGMYTIKPNDTLGKIAKDHDVTVEAIEKANPGVDSRKLKIGAQIKIP
jgi:N-acetylmuramoyl-L-alanine amidase